MVTEYFLQCSGPVKKIEKWGFYSPCSILSNSNAPGPDVQFLNIARAQKLGKGLTKACWYIHSDRVFFTKLWASQKIKKYGFHSPCSVLPNSNAPGPDVQFLKIAGARKPGEGLSIHPQWPSIFYNALGRSKKLKNEDSTAYAVFYLIVMHRVWMSNFWRTPELKNPVKACWYIHSDRSFFIRLWTGQFLPELHPFIFPADS